jgi:hypothetical protein
MEKMTKTNTVSQSSIYTEDEAHITVETHYASQENKRVKIRTGNVLLQCGHMVTLYM